ncbi:GerMN domain-containing protein [Anaerosalibacter sp. Marseille-P3206]|uniref:GerMN domain-containing protein n=1 Tax=Anaerosalibacter sp. Marseille-P3206 TaxID=1871005 RepID=UPI000984B049|nr:GerMN domain-containing protein [Anaerosalibacter sp. Marseille-P3206]
MKIKRFLCIVLILCIGISLYGCKKKSFLSNLFSKDDDIEIIRSDEENVDVTEDDGLRNTVLYFQNGEGFLVPVMRKIPWEEGIAKLALKNMTDNPSLRENLASTGLIPVIPPGTIVKGMTIDADTGICKVDFSQEFLNYQTEADEENLIKGVVYTLTEFPAIREVNILVEGKALDSLKYGTEINQPLRREAINLVKGDGEYRSKVVVYFKGNDNEEFEYFVPVTIPTLAPMPNVFTALEELFKGAPSDINLYSSIPSEANLQGVEVREGVAYVDLSFASLDEANERYILDEIYKSVGLTLSQFEDIEKVEMLIEGKTLKEAGIEYELNESIPVFANEY